MPGGLAEIGSMDHRLIAVGAVAGLATFAGGLVALALRRHLHLILGFSAGAILGVSLLELLPEAIRTGGGAFVTSSLYAGLGFLTWLLIDRMSSPAADRLSVREGRPARKRHLGPASLTVHSLLDGLAIGVAFRASETVGFVVAAAVILHDLSDGANTVNLGLIGGGAAMALLWLLADAVAPILGIALGHLTHASGGALSPLLAIFAGSFLYIGAGKLIAESYRRHPHLSTSLMSVLGFGAIYVLVTLSPG